MALTAPRNTPRREGRLTPVTAHSTCYGGGLVTLLAATGLAVPAGTASAGAAVGVARRTASAGEVFDVERGTFCFSNSSSTDLIAKKDIGANCYIVDDETVALTSGGDTREIAGVIVDVDAHGVWVSVGAA